MRGVRMIGHITIQAMMVVLVVFTILCAAIGVFVLAFGASSKLVAPKSINNVSVQDCAIARITENSDLYKDCKDAGTYYASPYEAKQALQAEATHQVIEMIGK